MTDRGTMLLAGMIALLAVSIRPASASLYTVTYTGTASGTDTNGVFGAAGASVTGMGFTSVFTYDTTLGHIASSSANYASLEGGSLFSLSTPITSAALTINGTTYSQNSGYRGEENLQGGQYPAEIQTESYSSTTRVIFDQGFVKNYIIDVSLDDPQSLMLNGQIAGFFGYDGENIVLANTQVTIGAYTPPPPPPPPVPVTEPTSLALLAGAMAVLAASFGFSRLVPHRHEVVRSSIEFA